MSLVVPKRHRLGLRYTVANLLPGARVSTHSRAITGANAGSDHVYYERLQVWWK